MDGRAVANLPRWGPEQSPLGRVPSAADLGLRWSDLDLDACRASIRQTVIAVKHTAMLGTPKTAKGRRTVTLDKDTVAALREHRKQRAAEPPGRTAPPPRPAGRGAPEQLVPPG